MSSGKLTNTLLALIFLALLAHLVVPLLRASEVSAQGSDSLSPSIVAAEAGLPSLDNAASQVREGLDGIARSNQQIANAILEHAQSNGEIARSLRDVAGGIQGLGHSTRGSAPAPRSKKQTRPEGSEESDPDWWKEYLE